MVSSFAARAGSAFFIGIARKDSRFNHSYDFIRHEPRSIIQQAFYAQKLQFVRKPLEIFMLLCGL